TAGALRFGYVLRGAVGRSKHQVHRETHHPINRPMNTRQILAVLLVLCAGWPFTMQQVGAQQSRTVTTGASFLLLSPDARNAGVGEAGTGLDADANALFTNAAKLAFAGHMGISLSYTPWMRQLVEDEHLSYLSAYRRM